MNANPPVFSLRDYVRVIFRHKFVIITVFIIAIIAAVVGLELKTPVYYAQVTMLISAEKQIDSPYYRSLSGQQIQEFTPSGIVNSNPVVKRAVNALKLYERPPDYEKQFCSPLKARLIDFKLKKLKSETFPLIDEQAYRLRIAVESLKRNINVEPIRDTNLFAIMVSDFSPEAAAEIANVVSRSYVIFDLVQQLAEIQLQYGDKHPNVIQLKNNIDRMADNLNGKTLPDIEAIGPATVKIIEQAEVPFVPSGTNKRTALLLTVFVALFLGIMLAFCFEYINHTIRSPQDIVTYLDLPHLGSIPGSRHRENGFIKEVKQGSASTRFYQKLSDNICLMIKDKNVKSLLITAPSPRDGSVSIIANLSNFVSGKAGHKVLLIDANLKTPAVHKFFNISDRPGLANVLERKISFEKAVQEINPYLTVLPAGDTSLETSLLITSNTMSEVIKVAKEKYGLVFINYSNLISLRETCILSSYVDGVIVVVSEGEARRQVINELIEPLREKKVNLIGAVLNNRTFPIPGVIYKRI